MRLHRLLPALLVTLAPALAGAQTVQILHAFGADPGLPRGGLVETPDGRLYGMSAGGGQSGTIYRIAPGGARSIVHRFDWRHFVDGRLVRGPDGVLFGTTREGGAARRGMVFGLDPATGVLRRLYEFTDADSGPPVGGVTFGPDGLLYGATSFGGPRGGGSVYRVHPQTGAVTFLHAFADFIPEPRFPETALTLAADGRLYGVTRAGVLYRVDPATGAVTPVLDFYAAVGWSPETALTSTHDGRLYGVTSSGGSFGGGMVLLVDPATANVTVVHAFGTGSTTDGRSPTSLVEGSDGHLYGTTFSSQTFVPTLFRVRRQGANHTVELLGLLDVATIGVEPRLWLAGSDGFVYGTAYQGGPGGDGSVFRFDPSENGPPGNALRLGVVHAFGPTADPKQPTAPALAADARLYGVLNEGGASDRGVVYRLTPSTGALDILGEVPGITSVDPSSSSLVLAPDGRLYGTTFDLGGDARIFSVDPATGTIATALTWPIAGGRPEGLVRAGNTLYGLRDDDPRLHIFRFDPTLGVTTDIATIDQTGALIRAHSGLVAAGSRLCGWRRAGVMSSTSSWFVYCVDPATGAISPAPVGGVPLLSSIGAIAGASDGRVFVTVNAAATSHVAVNDSAADAGRVVCTLPARSAGALTVTADGAVLGLITLGAAATPFRCDPSSGQVVLLPPLPTTLHDWSPLAPAGDGWLYGAAGNGPAGGGALFRLSLVATPSALDLDSDGLPNTWEGTYGLDPSTAAGEDGPAGDPDHDGADNAAELAAGTHPRGAVTRYLAEGATGSFFETRVALFNPTAEPATVLARFLTDAGAVVARTLVVPAFMRRTLDVGTLPGLEQASFSIVLESDRQVVVDRTMRWDASGYGSHTETGLRSPSPTWLLAEGSTSGDFSLFYLLQNPQAAAVTATVRYLRPSGVPPLVKTYTLPPLSRTTIGVDAAAPELASTDVSAAIEATAPIVVERAMYLSRPGQPFDAGHASAGVVAPALTWFLAEGATGPFFDLFVLIANPNPAPAAITVDYLVLGGSAHTKDLRGPGQRPVHHLGRRRGAAGGIGPEAVRSTPRVSTTVRSTNGVPIVVERTMWWPGPEVTPAYWYEAHNSPGSTVSARRWAFADAEVGGTDGAETYALIANPEAAPGRVRVTAFFDDGTNDTRTYDVPAKSRTNVPLGIALPATRAHGRFGVVVESIGVAPVSIVVERATYASPGGVVWAAGTNALAAPVP